MALLWRREAGGRRYELRAAGRTLRLYTDGVLHTAWNPARPFAGHVWDLLVLPAFLLEPPPRRVLALGVGGGAAIRTLRERLAPESVVGVDHDPVHLQVARRFFGVRGRGVRLVRADARDWVAAWNGPPFDLVIDDLFGGRGEPQRAVAPDTAWLMALARLVSATGALVVNCVSARELAGCGWRLSPGLQRRLPGALALSTPREENAVGAFFRHPIAARDLWRALEGQPGLDPRRTAARRRYRVRRLAPAA